MSRVFDAMCAFFDDDKWNYTRLGERLVLRMAFNGDDGQWSCFAQVRDEQEQFVFYSVAPIKVPIERRSAVSEFVARANYGMIIGNFELDFEDGEIRYKTAADVEGLDTPHQLFKGLVYTNVLTMDRYLKGFMAVAFGGIEPAVAIASVEDV